MATHKLHAGAVGTAVTTRAPYRRPGILIADDMGLILTLLKLEMERRRLRTWLAADGAEAFDVYRAHHEEIDIVLLDVQMPRLDGPRTLAAIQRLDPDIIACFMTGYSDTFTEEALLDCGVAGVFYKPFDPGEVADAVESLWRQAADARAVFSRSSL